MTHKSAFRIVSWYGQPHWRKIGLRVAMFLLVVLLAGCTPEPSIQHYENAEFGVVLEKPRNWTIKYHERNRSLEINFDGGISNRGKALIIIRGIALAPSSYMPIQELELTIANIGDLFNVQTVTINQEPVVIEKGGHEVGIAKISVPTMSIPESSTANQMGIRDPNVFQQIELLTMQCPNNFAMAYLYLGNNEQINAEAEAIVNSIELSCP
ncbi:MAG: hypothetical protein R3A44_40260 [Caldilineaceae bacterium]